MVVTWSQTAMPPVKRTDDPRQAGLLTRGSIGAGSGGAGMSGIDTAGDGPRTWVALMVMEDLTELWQVLVAVECVFGSNHRTRLSGCQQHLFSKV